MWRFAYAGPVVGFKPDEIKVKVTDETPELAYSLLQALGSALETEQWDNSLPIVIDAHGSDNNGQAVHQIIITTHTPQRGKGPMVRPRSKQTVELTQASGLAGIRSAPTRTLDADGGE